MAKTKLSQLTLGDLMNVTDNNKVMKASLCKVELVDIYHDVEQIGLLDKIKNFFLGKNIINIYHITFKFKVISDTGDTHIVFIRIKPDYELTNWTNNSAQVYCDCESFKYQSAYLLNQYNSLFLNDKTRIALGPAITQAPKNMARTSTLCKHSLAAVNFLVNNYASIMKTI